MNSDVALWIQARTGAHSISEPQQIQVLWSGYGSIERYGLKGGKCPSVILKKIAPPSSTNHPRGWNTDVSHQRKLKSYQVEAYWYKNYASRSSEDCRLPRLIAAQDSDGGAWLLLEDLDAAGFQRRMTSVDDVAFKACIRWLTCFHAQYLGVTPEGLWKSGTYWHLDTRPDELEVLKAEDPDLHTVAAELDKRLANSPFQTLVHGDAKLANFCFSGDGASVAAVDFQYIGGGCGMKDLAYFVGSCLSEHASARREAEILDIYFQFLRTALADKQVDIDALERDWRGLYPIAWTDFHRFLKGWSPGHWKVNTYSESVARRVIQSIRP